MKVGLIGFGKTGRAVAAVLLEAKTTRLEWVVRQSQLLEYRSASEFLGLSGEASAATPAPIFSSQDYTAAELFEQHPVDAIIDFSSESGLDYYGAEAAKRGIVIISAVSQYSEEKTAQIQALAMRTCVLHSPNITLGINFLIIAAKILKKIAPYTDIEVVEEHFKRKPEVSGTAKIIAQQLELLEGDVKSIRAGGIIGVHEILFGFPFQTVRLKHESISREAFGSGIVFALENLPKMSRGFFTMEDLLMPYFKLDDAANDAPADLSKKRYWWRFWMKQNRARMTA